MERSQSSLQKAYINRALVELKRRPDKLKQVKFNIYESMEDSALSKQAHLHLDQLKWIIETCNLNEIEDWLNHTERNPVGYKNWALAFKDLI